MKTKKFDLTFCSAEYAGRYDRYIVVRVSVLTDKASHTATVKIKKDLTISYVWGSMGRTYDPYQKKSLEILALHYYPLIMSEVDSWTGKHNFNKDIDKLEMKLGSDLKIYHVDYLANEV